MTGEGILIDIKELYTTYRPLLFTLAYRMLGRVMDAEDMVQDTFLALERKKQENITNMKAYLCKMLTNRCLDYLRSARKQREVYVGSWLPEPLLDDAVPNDPMEQVIARDSLSIAYLMLMEKLSAVERAVLILREALGFEYNEIAEVLGKEEANCRKIFSRGKQKLCDQPHRSAAFADPRVIYDFLGALQAGDSSRLLSLLADDVVLYSDGGGKVTAATKPVISAKRVSGYLFGLMQKSPADLLIKVTSVNGTPGLVVYAGTQLLSVVGFQQQDGQIVELYNILNPDKLRHLSRSQRLS